MDWMMLGASLILCSSLSCCDVSSLISDYYSTLPARWRQREQFGLPKRGASSAAGLNLAALVYGVGEDALGGVLYLPAGGQPASQAGDLHTRRGKQR